MGKICWINGQPYSVRLPTGGKDKDDLNNQWNEMIDFLMEDCDNLFHWDGVFSWCQNKGGALTLHRAVRGCSSARRWNYYSTAYSYSNVGFRPVLTPLSADTLKSDLSLLVDIPDGQRIALASLYLDGNPVDLSEEKGPNYNKGEEIILGNRDKNKNNWLYVIKFKNLLWTDRNILINISWNDLKEQGYVN